jgi:Cu/Ag efflux pump CusA
MLRDFLVTVAILSVGLGTWKASELTNLPNLTSQQVIVQSSLHGISWGIGLTLIFGGLGIIKDKSKSS